MNKMPKQAFIFDFFDVLHQDPLKAWRNKHGLKAENGIADVAFRLDTGVISYPQYVEELAALNGQTAQDLHTEFASAHLNEEMVTLIGKLKETSQTGLLSNTNHEEIDPILERHNLEPLFHEIVISSDTGLAKPDPRIYQLILDRMGIAPDAAVFIDDNPENIAGAASIGMEGICYTSMDSLYKEISDYTDGLFVE